MVQGQLIDRLEIEHVLYAYAYCMDDRDWDGLREEVFTADVVADYLDHGPKEGIDTVVDLAVEVLTALDATQHLIANPVIEFDGDTATSRCYLHAQHVLEGLPGGDQFVLAGTYEDELVRTDRGWRISKRVLKQTWVSGNPEVIPAAMERMAASSD